MTTLFLILFSLAFICGIVAVFAKVANLPKLAKYTFRAAIVLTISCIVVGAVMFS